MVVTSDIEDKDHYDEEGRERGMGDLRRENDDFDLECIVFIFNL